MRRYSCLDANVWQWDFFLARYSVKLESSFQTPTRVSLLQISMPPFEVLEVLDDPTHNSGEAEKQSDVVAAKGLSFQNAVGHNATSSHSIAVSSSSEEIAALDDSQSDPSDAEKSLSDYYDEGFDEDNDLGNYYLDTIEHHFDVRFPDRNDILLVQVATLVTKIHQCIGIHSFAGVVSPECHNYPAPRHAVFDQLMRDGWGDMMVQVRDVLLSKDMHPYTVEQSSCPSNDRCCSICEEAFLEPSNPLGCGHAVCIDCWRIHTKVLYDEMLSAPNVRSNPYAIKCPCINCTCIMDDAMFDHFVVTSPHLWNQLVFIFNNALRATLPQDSIVKNCINADCNMVAISKSKDVNHVLPERSVVVMCDCGIQWCFSCHDDSIGSHLPLSCAQVQAMIVFGKSMLRVAKNPVDDDSTSLYASSVTLEESARINLPYHSWLVRALLDPYNDDVTRISCNDLVEATAKVCHGCQNNFLFRPYMVDGGDANSSLVYCGGSIDSDGGCGIAFCWICEAHIPYSTDSSGTLHLEHTCEWKLMTPSGRSAITSSSSNKVVVNQMNGHVDLDKYRICSGGCGAVIEKSFGCDRMECLCGKRFCWHCNKSDCSAPSGKCKRMVELGVSQKIGAFLFGIDKVVGVRHDDHQMATIKMVAKFFLTNCEAGIYFGSRTRSALFAVIYAINLIRWCRDYCSILKLTGNGDNRQDLVLHFVNTTQNILSEMIDVIRKRLNASRNEMEPNYSLARLASCCTTLDKCLIALSCHLFDSHA